MALANLTAGASVSATNTKAFGTATATRQVSESASLSLTEGTAANQADKLYDQELTIAASATTTLDLSGVLTDAYGDALTFAKVKAIYVKADSGNTNDVVVHTPTDGVPLFLATADREVEQVADPGITLKPGAFMLLGAPGLAGLAAVTNSTADKLKLTNSAGTTSVIARVVILGTSA